MPVPDSPSAKLVGNQAVPAEFATEVLTIIPPADSSRLSRPKLLKLVSLKRKITPF